MSRYPRKEAEDEPEKPRKGTSPVWKPAGKVSYLNVPEGHKGRWCDSDPMRLAAKRAEGWEFVNKTNFPELDVFMEKDTTKDGTPLNGAIRHRELVGMCLPNEMVEARKKHYEEITASNTAARIRRTADKENLGHLSDAIKNPRLTVDRVVID